jgi:hypothetical protein
MHTTLPLSPSSRNFFLEFSVNFSNAFLTFSLLILWKSICDSFFIVFGRPSFLETSLDLELAHWVLAEAVTPCEDEVGSWLWTRIKRGDLTSLKCWTVDTTSRHGRSWANEAVSRHEGHIPAVVGFILLIVRGYLMRGRRMRKSIQF